MAGNLNVLPNGSRLSCGAHAGGRKRPVRRYLRAGAQTYASSESRPRQLQALVRQQLPHLEMVEIEVIEVVVANIHAVMAAHVMPVEARMFVAAGVVIGVMVGVAVCCMVG